MTLPVIVKNRLPDTAAANECSAARLVRTESPCWSEAQTRRGEETQVANPPRRVGDPPSRVPDPHRRTVAAKPWLGGRVCRLRENTQRAICRAEVGIGNRPCGARIDCTNAPPCNFLSGQD